MIDKQFVTRLRLTCGADEKYGGRGKKILCYADGKLAIVAPLPRVHPVFGLDRRRRIEQVTFPVQRADMSVLGEYLLGFISGVG